MKLITLWEPWSSLLAHSEKKIETRHWSTDYRGPVAIHSAKGGLGMTELFATCATDPFTSVLKRIGVLRAGMRQKEVARSFPKGDIIAVGTLVHCLPYESYRCLPGIFEEYPDLDTDQERAFGNYGPGRYGLVFENVLRLTDPIPYKSRQGKLLDLEAEIVRAIVAQAPAYGA